jgi:hypothetical protein
VARVRRRAAYAPRRSDAPARRTATGVRQGGAHEQSRDKAQKLT